MAFPWGPKRRISMTKKHRKSLLEELRKLKPLGVQLNILLHATNYLQKSLKNKKNTLKNQPKTGWFIGIMIHWTPKLQALQALHSDADPLTSSCRLRAGIVGQWTGPPRTFRNVAWFRASETKNFGVGDFLRNEKCITLQKSWTVRRGEEIFRKKRVNSNPLRTWDLTALHGISPNFKDSFGFFWGVGNSWGVLPKITVFCVSLLGENANIRTPEGLLQRVDIMKI